MSEDGGPMPAGGAPPAAMRRLRVSVVCPFYNEEKIVTAAAERMRGTLSSKMDSWELILVDDGSVDGSLGALLSWLQEVNDSSITVLSYPVNRGRGRALKTGIDAASGDIVVTTEVDCSWGLDIVSRLVNELEGRPDVHFVVASPHCQRGGMVAVPRSRRWLSRFGNLLVSMFFKSGLTMHTGMTRAYRREVVQPLVAREDGKEFHLEVLLKLLTLGFRASEIPATIDWSWRLARQGKLRRGPSLLALYPTVLTHLAFVAVVQPMRYFGLLSGLTLAAAAVFLFLAVRNYLVGDVAIFYALTGLFMAAFSLLFIGFSVVFAQLRDISRESWMRHYPDPAPLAMVPGTKVFRVEPTAVTAMRSAP
jgi:glycosyltransferase involved in cell wall biosynthesis